MKESKYRGWSTDLKCWVYGSYYEHCSCAVCFAGEDKPEYHQARIIFEKMGDWNLPYRTMIADVVPESVGAFSGCTLNGVEIYEGDVITCGGIKYLGIVKYGKYSSHIGSHMGFYIDWAESSFLRNDIFYWIENRYIKVIGNLYENPELEDKVYGKDKG